MRLQNSWRNESLEQEDWNEWWISETWSMIEKENLSSPVKFIWILFLEKKHLVCLRGQFREDHGWGYEYTLSLSYYSFLFFLTDKTNEAVASAFETSAFFPLLQNLLLVTGFVQPLPSVSSSLPVTGDWFANFSFFLSLSLLHLSSCGLFLLQLLWLLVLLSLQEVSFSFFLRFFVPPVTSVFGLLLSFSLLFSSPSISFPGKKLTDSSYLCFCSFFCCPIKC